MTVPGRNLSQDGAWPGQSAGCCETSRISSSGSGGPDRFKLDQWLPVGNDTIRARMSGRYLRRSHPDTSGDVRGPGLLPRLFPVGLDACSQEGPASMCRQTSYPADAPCAPVRSSSRALPSHRAPARPAPGWQAPDPGPPTPAWPLRRSRIVPGLPGLVPRFQVIAQPRGPRRQALGRPTRLLEVGQQSPWILRSEFALFLGIHPPDTTSGVISVDDHPARLCHAASLLASASSPGATCSVILPACRSRRPGPGAH